MKFALVMMMGVLLSSCSLFQTQNPPQEAYALNKEYQAVAVVAEGVLKSDVATPVIECSIKAADSVAFGYVTQVTVQAQAWNSAPDANKPEEQTVFDKLVTLGRAALDNLNSIMKIISQGGNVTCPSPTS